MGNLTKNSEGIQNLVDTSSDDNQLLFVSRNWQDGFKIFSIDIDSKHLTQLTKRLYITASTIRQITSRSNGIHLTFVFVGIYSNTWGIESRKKS